MKSVTTSRFFIRGLRIDARIGVYEAEKAAPQPILVDVEGALPGELACHTDCLEHTINYAAVIERLSNIALNQPCELAEAMAYRMATQIQSEFGVDWIALTLAKLAPFPGVEVGVTIVRGSPHVAAEGDTGSATN